MSPLEIHGTVTLSADLEIPANITTIMKAGSKITLSGTRRRPLHRGLYL